MALVGIDQGGTHTDCVALVGGEIVTIKVPTEEDRVRSTVTGMEELGVDLSDVEVFNHGTTEGVNAILERDIPKIGFLTTEGHRDILDMGRSWRPFEALHDPDWRRSFSDQMDPLVPRYLRRGVRERIDRDGDIVVPLDLDHAREQLDVFARCDVDGVAVCLLNAFTNEAHEERLRRLVEEEYDFPVSISTRVSSRAKEYSRASTTTISNIMKLTLPGYCDDVSETLRDRGFDGEFNLIESSGGVIPADVIDRRPHDVMYSGPAAGTISSAYFGETIGTENLFCVDMGGTSADVSLIEGGSPGVETSFEIEHDLLVDTLAVEIFTAGAGGGSLVYLDELGDLQVGPESAGSVPGPVCYGRGGEQPSITDVYLLNNILQEDEFLGGDMTLHSDLAEEALMDLDLDMDLEDRLEYAQRVGREHLLNGLERVAVERAIDPREYSLLAYGAAGPMIIPEILDDVGVREIIIPPAPGEFSAMGLLSTDLIYSETTTEYIPLEPDSADEISAIFRDLEEGIFDSVDVDEDAGDLVVERFFDGRVQGQTWDTPLISAPAGDLDDADIERMVENFHAEYERKWNNRFESYPVTATTYRVRVTQPMPKIEHTEIERADGEAPQHGTTEVIKQETLEYGEYRRDELQWGHEIEGPAIVRQPTATIQICDGQRAEVGQYGEITITRSE